MLCMCDQILFHCVWIVDILVLWTDEMQAAAGSATQAQADVLNGINSFNTAAAKSNLEHIAKGLLQNSIACH